MFYVRSCSRIIHHATGRRERKFFPGARIRMIFLPHFLVGVTCTICAWQRERNLLLLHPFVRVFVMFVLLSTLFNFAPVNLFCLLLSRSFFRRKLPAAKKEGRRKKGRINKSLVLSTKLCLLVIMSSNKYTGRFCKWMLVTCRCVRRVRVEIVRIF